MDGTLVLFYKGRSYGRLKISRFIDPLLVQGCTRLGSSVIVCARQMRYISDTHNLQSSTPGTGIQTHTAYCTKTPKDGAWNETAKMWTISSTDTSGSEEIPTPQPGATVPLVLRTENKVNHLQDPPRSITAFLDARAG